MFERSQIWMGNTLCLALVCAGYFTDVVFSIFDDHNSSGPHAPRGNLAAFRDALSNAVRFVIRDGPQNLSHADLHVVHADGVAGCE